jgi:hypothetical protein
MFGSVRYRQLEESKKTNGLRNVVMHVITDYRKNAHIDLSLLSQAAAVIFLPEPPALVLL